MIARRALSLAGAAAISFALLWLMHALIAAEAQSGGADVRGTVVDFVRLKQESETETKRRTLPKKQIDQSRPPPTPEIRAARTTRPDLGDASGEVIAIPTAELAEGPRAGAALSDMDAVPLVRIAPEYPERAASRGIGGWVLLEFTVTTTGSTKDVRVVDSDPAGTFDRVSIRAVERFKYRPKVVDGKPVEQRGVQIVLNFDPTIREE
jgi:protein TonB